MRGWAAQAGVRAARRVPGAPGGRQGANTASLAVPRLVRPRAMAGRGAGAPGLPGEAPGIFHAPRRVLRVETHGPLPGSPPPPGLRRLHDTHALRQHHCCGGTIPPIERIMSRHRRGRPREAMLHADAARLLAEADYPPAVTQTMLLALRGGRPGTQTCLACGKTAQHCQLWLPPAL
jgi:hypothetical protein